MDRVKLQSFPAAPLDLHKALLRIAVVYNFPVACNRATADFMISSPLMNECYEPIRINYTDYINREVSSESEARIMRALRE